MPRGIDVEKSRPGVRRGFGLGATALGQETRQPPNRVPRRTAAGPRQRAPTPKAPAPDLPPIAAKADDLEAIKKAVDDAASVGGGLWLSYLFVLFYLAVAAGAVTHDDLFLREGPVKLPFLNIELPLLAFFFLAPILFLIVHAYTLVHLVMLTDKAKRFHEALRQSADGRGGPRSDPRGSTAAIAEQHFRPVSCWAAGRAREPLRLAPAGNRLDDAGRRAGPLAAAHADPVPALSLELHHLDPSRRPPRRSDPSVVAMAQNSGRTRRRWPPPCGLPDLDQFLVRAEPRGRPLLLTEATFPGEWQDNLPNQRVFWFPFPKPDRELVTLNRLVFQSDVNDTNRRRKLPFSNTLVLPGLNVYEGLKIDDPEKLKGRDYLLRARGRDLRGAIFDLAVLPKVDLEGANLQGASLFRAQLRDASLDGAQLRGASLEGAQLQGAGLDRAQLQGASLDGAQLQGASLAGAQLQGARLWGSQLQGAWLGFSQLQGASLDDAHLEGAWLQLRRFRPRRSSLRSSKARASPSRSFREHRSIARSFRARRSLARKASTTSRSFREHRGDRTRAGGDRPVPFRLSGGPKVRNLPPVGQGNPNFRPIRLGCRSGYKMRIGKASYPWNESAYQALRATKSSCSRR